MAELKAPAARSYRHTPDMGGISVLGGAYESTCQDMLEAGVEWLDAHPERRPLELKTYGQVYGLFNASNDATVELLEAVKSAGKGEQTAPMVQAVMARLVYIAAHGWSDYCAVLRKARAAQGG